MASAVLKTAYRYSLNFTLIYCFSSKIITLIVGKIVINIKTQIKQQDFVYKCQYLFIGYVWNTHGTTLLHIILMVRVVGASELISQ